MLTGMQPLPSACPPVRSANELEPASHPPRDEKVSHTLLPSSPFPPRLMPSQSDPWRLARTALTTGSLSSFLSAGD
eukprot:193771-Hanusia_phi.AAC.2